MSWRAGSRRARSGMTLRTTREEHPHAAKAHRAALLADPQRPQDHDHARGVRAALRDQARQHRQGRPVQARVPGHLRPTTACPPSSIPTGPAASRSRSSSRARSCSISAARPASSIPQEERARVEVEQWLYWQMANLGPNCGQAHHFRNYAQEKITYAIDRYTNEVNRLYGVMDTRLKDRDYLAGDYSIADMASYPWVRPYKNQGQDLAEFPNLEKWFQRMHDRPAVAKAREDRRGAARQLQPRHRQGRPEGPVRPARAALTCHCHPGIRGSRDPALRVWAATRYRYAPSRDDSRFSSAR